MSPARKLHLLMQEDFDQLLFWLDPDPDRAGARYESVRWLVIPVLAARGCLIPEDLADGTIDRVSRRVPEIRAAYVGDQAVYFLGVMNNVHHEYLKRPTLVAPPPPSEDAAGKEATHACLESCLQKLAPHARQMIERYYAEN